MKTVAGDITQLIGGTPMLLLEGYMRRHSLTASVMAKLEYFNPGGSVKDRVALAMIDDAVARGALAPGGTIIEPTSGNTGIGLAMVAAARGYSVILTMPESMSAERRRILKGLGARLELTPAAAGMSGAIARAKELNTEIPGSIILGQFDNPANPAVHERTTGPEIWEATAGTVDIFVAGVGTGGTVSGVGRALKRLNPGVRIVAVEPAESAVLSGGAPGQHKIQGIGAGFVPKNYDPSVVDEVMPVTGNDAIAAAREVATADGVLVGISSGAALHAAARLAQRSENRGKTIVVLMPDTGERYISTELFAE